MHKWMWPPEIYGIDMCPGGNARWNIHQVVHYNIICKRYLNNRGTGQIHQNYINKSGPCKHWNPAFQKEVFMSYRGLGNTHISQNCHTSDLCSILYINIIYEKRNPSTNIEVYLMTCSLELLEWNVLTMSATSFEMHHKEGMIAGRKDA